MTVTSEVDAFPKGILPQEEALAELTSISRRSRCVGRAVLEDQFALVEVTPKRETRTKQNKRGIGDAATDSQLSIRQGPVVRPSKSAVVAFSGCPSRSKRSDGGRVQVAHVGGFAHLGREVRPNLVEHRFEFIRAKADKSIAGPLQLPPVRMLPRAPPRGVQLRFVRVLQTQLNRRSFAACGQTHQGSPARHPRSQGRK